MITLAKGHRKKSYKRVSRDMMYNCYYCKNTRDYEDIFRRTIHGNKVHRIFFASDYKRWQYQVRDPLLVMYSYIRC